MMDQTSPWLHDLTPRQAEAATRAGPVLVLAGAGTGKTKTLTCAVAHRIQARGIAPGRILAVTFTNKAAAEMTGRIRAILGGGVAPTWIGTFHGLGARQLRIEPEVANLRAGFDILDADDSKRIVKRVMKALNLASGEEGTLIGRDPLKAMCNRISRFKDGLITPEDAPARVEAMIAQARNQAQYSWIRLLSATHREVFAVGDDDQSIYSWRGSDVGLIRRFARDFPGAVEIKLEENFRSTGHILDAANAVIAQDRTRLGKTLFTRRAGGDPVEIVGFRNGEAEAIGIVNEMRQRHVEGVGWDAMAVLYRSNALSRIYEEALMRARVPYVLVGDVGSYQRGEIKDTLALLRLSATPDDVQADEALRRVINVPARGFGAKAMLALEQEAAWRDVPLLAALETTDLPPKTRAAGLAFADAIRNAGRDAAATLADQMSLLLDATGYRAMLRDSRSETTEGRLDNIQELIQLAGSFHSARELLDHAALSTGGPNEEVTERVRLLTLHRGKGLEFPHVFLPAWEAGLFPPDYGDRSEERRLAYVAITRGMQRVSITHCEFRRGYTAPSCFIDDIPHQHRVDGWLRRPADRMPRPRPRPTSDALDAAWPRRV